jgi:hypothetical protein
MTNLPNGQMAEPKDELGHVEHHFHDAVSPESLGRHVAKVGLKIQKIEWERSVGLLWYVDGANLR